MMRRAVKHEVPAVERALRIADQALNPVRVVGPEDFGSLGLPEHEQSKLAKLLAFRILNDSKEGKRIPEIFVNRAAPEFRLGEREDLRPLADLILASALVHEQTHEIERDEYPAYQMEMDFMLSKLPTLPKQLQPHGLALARELSRIAQSHRKAK